MPLLLSFLFISSITSGTMIKKKKKENHILARQVHSTAQPFLLCFLKEDFFYLPLAFESSTKASNAKGTLLIHQRGDTEGCSGSLDRQRLTEREREE